MNNFSNVILSPFLEFPFILVARSFIFEIDCGVADNIVIDNAEGVLHSNRPIRFNHFHALCAEQH